MKKHIAILIVVITVTALVFELQVFVKAQTTATPEYILKAWQVSDGESGVYLWSIEGQPNQGYTGTLYKSLASPSLRSRIELFPVGTKLTWHFVGAGTADALPHEDFKNFRAFCASKHVSFREDISLF